MKPITEVVAEQLIKFAVKQAMGFLVSKIPWLAWGPLGSIASTILTKLAWVFATKTVMGANIFMLGIDVDWDVADAEEISEKARDAVRKLNPEINKDELDEIDKDMREKFGDLISQRPGGYI